MVQGDKVEVEGEEYEVVLDKHAYDEEYEVAKDRKAKSDDHWPKKRVKNQK